jgi:hypothetical protein
MTGQGSELSAPPLAQHGPFQHQIPVIYNPSYMPINNPSMSQIHDVSNVPTINQLHGHSPYPPPGHHPHYNPYAYQYQFPGHPRSPPVFRNESDLLHSNMGFYDTGGMMQGHQPFIPPRTPSHNHAVPAQFNTGPSQSARRRYNHRMSVSSVMRNSPAEDVRAQERNQDPPPGLRRLTQQEHGQSNDQTINNQEQRPWMPSESQGHRADRSVSSRISNNRRDFARYSVDLSNSSTSSDAEEAAARAPPVSRMRHRPRAEVRPRPFGHRPHFDPNIATPRQIEELKDSLQRRLPSELPEEASKACDICQKDYSATHVAPAEEQEIAVVLACGHSFGEFCIFQWVGFRTADYATHMLTPR